MKPPYTAVTVTAGGAGLSCAFEPGDRLHVADQRTRWRRCWDWLLRRPKPQLDYVVTGCVGTVLTVELAVPSFGLSRWGWCSCGFRPMERCPCPPADTQ
jgi:hypothetical protein